MSISKNKTLTNDVAALLEGNARSWPETSSVLDRVERTRYWEGRAQSFSEWIALVAHRGGTNESILWRYLGAGRYYRKLRKSLKRRGIVCPPLERLPETISPENLEILAKIERVMPKRAFEEVGERVLGRSITRDELRELWATYRPVLTGRTARGRGTATPRIDPKDAGQLAQQKKAATLTMLMSAKPTWTGIDDPYFYYAMRDVAIPAAGPKKYAFDMLALVRKIEDSPIMMIGVEVSTAITSEVVYKLGNLAPYCNRLWLGLVTEVKSHEVADVPKYMGILRSDGTSPMVLRPAEESPGFKTGEMAKELLPRILRP
jgi:hypothetical protein